MCSFQIDVPDTDDYTSIQHFPEEVQTDLIAAAEWLNLNDRDEFMNVYATVRGQVMEYNRKIFWGSSSV